MILTPLGASETDTQPLLASTTPPLTWRNYFSIKDLRHVSQMGMQYLNQFLVVKL